MSRFGNLKNLEHMNIHREGTLLIALGGDGEFLFLVV